MLKTAITRTYAFFLIGLLAPVFSADSANYGNPAIAILMSQITDPLVAAGSLFHFSSFFPSNLPFSSTPISGRYHDNSQRTTIIPGIAALLIFSFIGHWNDFTTAQFMICSPELRTLTLGIYTLIGLDETDFRLFATAALINIVPVIFVYSFLQPYLVSGLTAGVVKQ